jgi:hypothetical protein
MKYVYTIVFALLFTKIHSQIDSVLLTQQSIHLFPSFPVKSSYTSLFDRRPQFNILYSANMESGLGIYETTNNNIANILNIPKSVFNNLDVATIEQRAQSLFIGIGDFQVNNNTHSGLAILDISNPQAPVIKDVWDTTLFTHGISHLLIDGNYAYLSTMTHGIFILDIANENNIIFKSRLALDLNYPSPSVNAHNARGLKIKNDTLYVCFDRGGLRMVDVSDKSNPVEVYKYINTSLNSQAAAAYNDIAIKGNHAFVSVDYCGLEVIDISNIPFTSIQWYNPWGCTTTNWSGSPLHLNEVMLANNDSLLFVTAGQSEVFVFDITNPLNTTKIGEFVNLNDTLATHGLDVFNNSVSLSLIHTPIHIPPFTPFYSDPGGLKILSYQIQNAVSVENTQHTGSNSLSVYPNPTAINPITINCNSLIKTIAIYDDKGQTVFKNLCVNTTTLTINTNYWQQGIYYLHTNTALGIKTKKIIVHR